MGYVLLPRCTIIINFFFLSCFLRTRFPQFSHALSVRLVHWPRSMPGDHHFRSEIFLHSVAAPLFFFSNFHLANYLLMGSNRPEHNEDGTVVSSPEYILRDVRRVSASSRTAIPVGTPPIAHHWIEAILYEVAAPVREQRWRYAWWLCR